MPTTHPSAAIRHLRRAALLGAGVELSDGQLLEAFIARRDEAAFETLVRRHGSMVLGVCQRVIGNRHDAEDAFQATFLVLARKAVSVVPREAVGNWLYGVAYRTARRAKAVAVRLWAREKQVKTMPQPMVKATNAVPELEHLLDEELNRLPDKYRLPLVLCELESRSRKEVARHLNLSEGTLSSRLARARKMLAQRLSRRGLTGSAGTVAAVLAGNAASASVPLPLVSSTVKAAILIAAGQAAASGLISAQVAALTEGVLKTMMLTKLKIWAAVLVAVAVIIAGASAVTFPVRAAQQAQRTKSSATPDGRKSKTESTPVVVREDAIVSQLAWSPNGKIVATVGLTYEPIEVKDSDGNNPQKVLITHSTIKLWDASTGKLKRSLGEEKKTFITSIAFSPDGKTAAIAVSKRLESNRGETEVRLLDAETWAPKNKVDPVGFVMALAFSPDGKRLAFGGSSHLAENGSFVKLWDVHKVKLIGGTKERKPEVKVLPQPELGGKVNKGHVTCLAFSPDGMVLAAGDRDAKIRLFDGHTGKPRAVLDDHSDPVDAIAFSPDGKTLVSGSEDKTAKLWDMPTAKLRRTLKGNKGSIMAIAFSPDGRQFATGGGVKDNKQIVEVILWDGMTGELKQTLPDQTLPVFTLAFSPDGRTLAIGGGDGGELKDGGRTTGQFKLWKLDPPPANNKR